MLLKQRFDSSTEPVTREARDRFLEQVIGIAPELVAMVPDDRPLPSPPKAHRPG
jgi:hypothetical protein